MSYKVFCLQDVPDEEANGVRQCLAQSEIKFYETPSSLFSAGAIWVYEESDITLARERIDKFEVEWKRNALESDVNAGKLPWMEIFANLVLWLLIAVVLLSIFGHFTTY